MKINNNKFRHSAAPRWKGRDKGIVLLLAAFIILLSSILVIGFLEVAATDIEISRNQKGNLIAAYIADTGVEAAIYDILNGGDGNIARTEFTVGGNTYYYTVTQTDLTGNVYTIESLGEYGSFRKTIQAKIRILAGNASVRYWKEI